MKAEKCCIARSMSPRTLDESLNQAWRYLHQTQTLCPAFEFVNIVFGVLSPLQTIATKGMAIAPWLISHTKDWWTT